MLLNSKIRSLSLAALLAVMLAVPATEGPSASPAFAAKKCGGKGQRACTIFERPGKPCDAGLTQVAPSRLELGKCKRTTTKVPSQNQTDYRNPAPQQAKGSARDDGFYNAHGGATAIKLCNRSRTRTIYAAIGYYDWGIYGDKPNWSSAGWWPLDKGQCKSVGLIDDYEVGAPYAGDVYVMAVGGGLAWEGQGGSFCIDRSGDFRIKDADRRRCSDENTLYGFEFIVNPGVVNHFDFEG